MQPRKPTPNHIPTVRELSEAWHVEPAWLGERLLKISTNSRVSTVELLAGCGRVPLLADRCKAALEGFAQDLDTYPDRLWNLLIRQCAEYNVEPEELVAALWFMLETKVSKPDELASRRLELALAHVHLRKAHRG